MKEEAQDKDKANNILTLAKIELILFLNQIIHLWKNLLSKIQM
jgi:hypothetical protein